ncbi:ribonuclease HII [Ornithinibacillus gellani]|uniref:ribonuclease HII n=1 Tax=Ornithinibacillus gellani TaxID=2293253 RepID=UPI000F4717FB|nr:ribonuclease HII [Ornithinibacillus gellani]TQS75576.1 ribonuclease HII [Ornithinibacillus gellani]
MKQLSIAAIKQQLLEQEMSQEFLEQLKRDERKGVQALLRTYERKQQKLALQKNAFQQMSQFERKANAMGKQFVAGIDEAGRGPLAGPVVAAAVILPSDFMLLGLNDSKQLSERMRNAFFTVIKEQAISYGISIIGNDIIDKVNIFEATKLAMKDACEQLKPSPQHVLIDAVKLNDLGCTSEILTKGDQRSISIAAASVLAKVTRDQLMAEIHAEYPAYDFQSNMGYGTKHHLDMLKEHGPSPYHRRSFSPVKESI